MLLLRRNAPKNVRFLFKEADRQKNYKAKKLVGFSRKEMYEVVADVVNYDKFLPFCTKSTILSKSSKEMHANLEIGFHPIIENYDSHVLLDEPFSVKAICTNGRLFYHLESSWVFFPGLPSNPRSCIIDFSVKFNFKSVFYSQIASIFFDRLVNQMEVAFMGEVTKRFGAPTIETHVLN